MQNSFVIDLELGGGLGLGIVQEDAVSQDTADSGVGADRRVDDVLGGVGDHRLHVDFPLGEEVSDKCPLEKGSALKSQLKAIKEA